MIVAVALLVAVAAPLPAMVEWAPGEGVTIMTTDQRFALTLRGRLQLRFDVVGPDDEEDETEASFQVRRLRFSFQGHVLSKDWRYQVQLAFANRDTEPDLRLPLRDAVLTYAGFRDANIRVGQMKVPSGRQRVTSSANLQMVDRSVANAEFNLDRDVGVQLFSTDLGGLGDIVQYNLGMFGGEGRSRLGGTLGFLYVARIAINPFGKFDDFSEADFERSLQPRLSVSLSGVFNQQTKRARSTFDETFVLGGYDYVHGGFDALLKWSGLSVLTELYYRDVFGVRSRTGGDGTIEVSRAGIGGVVQVGYFLADGIEVVGRFARVLPLRETDVLPSGELLAGANGYLLKHSLKVQADAGWAFGDRFNNGHPQLRLQTQIAF